MTPQLNPNDPRVQALIAQMRAQQGGVAPSGPPVGQMPAQMQGPAPVAGQMPGQMAGGPPTGAPPGAGMPPGGMPPPGGPGGPPGGMPGAAPPQGGGQLDPAMVDAVIGMQGQAGQRQGLDRQYKLADALRADSKAQLQARTIPSSTGGMVIAPNWAQGLTSVAGNIMADRRTADADRAGAGLDKERQGAQRGYFDAVTGQKKKKPEQQANWTEDTLRME